MKNLFGKKQAPDKKEPDIKEKAMSTMNKLGQSICDMEEKITFLENKKNAETEKAKQKLKAGDKTGAKQALSKKKKYDEQIKQYDGAIMMMDEQKMLIESMQTLRDVFETVKIANETLKDAQKGLNIDDINDIKEDLEVNILIIIILINQDIKANADEDEMEDVISEYSVADNAELDDELDKLANEMMNEELPKTGTSRLYLY